MRDVDLRRRTVDGRGLADIRLMQVDDGPGRGQRLFVVRNAVGIGFEIAVDRGFDISSLTFRGINIGFNSANGLPWPSNSLDAEEGVGFYRNFDGFLVTCGLDHIGAAKTADASHLIHKHRKQLFHPLHGRIGAQRAQISGYGIDWEAEVPVIRAEAIVRQSSVFGENLVLKRRISIDVFGDTIRIDDHVTNEGFRPTPHAILYHFNFGYPFLDEATTLSGDLDAGQIADFNAEDKTPRDDYVDSFQEFPVQRGPKTASVTLENPKLMGGISATLNFAQAQLPTFGIWRAFQSGVYALALEPTRRSDPQMLGPGEGASYGVTLTIGSSTA